MIKKVSNRINKNELKFNVLGDILDALRFRGSIFFRSNLAAPWGMSLGKVNYPRFHIALSGDFYIGTNTSDDTAIQVKQMDIVMLPHGNLHWIADQTHRKLTPSEEASYACELGSPLFQQGEITNRLICGQVCFDSESMHPVINTLPAVVHFTDIKLNDPIWMTVSLIDTELHKTDGSQTSIIDRLTEVLFLQLLSKYVNENNEITGFFAALRNQRIHKTLEYIHDKPQDQWSLELLGEQVGMSRATLARQFKKAVGIPPMTYLHNWRMMKAHYLLKNSSHSLDQIAELVGFSTARTLNKAFQRYYGFTPNELRHL